MEEIDEQRRTSFDACAAQYDEVRPSYPDELVERVLARGGRRVLEIGAGTGKATIVLARCGASVVALEPGPALAAILRENMAGRDVEVVESTFEAWPLERRFDVVAAAQSIHWVDPAVRYAKAADALAPGGVIAVIRNEHAVTASGVREEIDAAYVRHYPPAMAFPERSFEWARRHWADEITASGRFEPVELVEHAWTATFPTRRYLMLLDTYSDHAVLPPAQREPLYAEIGAAIDRHGGVLEVPYVSMAFVARVR